MAKARYLGIARNKARLGLMCLAYNMGLSFNSKMGAKLAIGMPSGLKLALSLLPAGNFSLQFACFAK